MMPVVAIVYAIVFICVALLLHWRSGRVGGHLPPGPPPLPLFGNLFDFTLKELWLRATSQWAQKYGGCRSRYPRWYIRSAAVVQQEILSI